VYYQRVVLLLFLSVIGLFSQPSIQTTDQSLPIGRVEIPLDATGGTPPYNWSLVSCTIPGLALRTDVPQGWSATAGLIGVATTKATYPCEVRVTDSASPTPGAATKTISVTVHGLVITRDWEMPDGAVGVAYSQAIPATGGVGLLAFSLPGGTPFPAGLSLASNGQISGTPSVGSEGTYEFDYTVTDGTSSIGRRGRIYISKLNITTATQLPVGTQGVPYNQTITVTGGTPPYTFTHGCCLGGGSGISLSSAGVLSGTPNGPAYWQSQVTVTDSTGAWARRNFALGVVGTPLTLPSIDTVSLEDLSLGEQRGWSIFVSGGKPPYTWSVSGGSLPPGMGMLDPAAKPPYWASTALTLMGTPTAVGSYTFTLTATDSSSPAQSASRSYTWRVSPLWSQDWPDGTYGAAYSQKLRILGGAGPYTAQVVLGTLPSGLTMAGDGQLAGTPQETGGFRPQVKMNGPAGELIRGVGINIWTSPASNVWINDGNWLGDILVNQPWSRTFSAGGAASFNWSLVSGAIPSGMTFSAGTLSGTPTVTGNYTFAAQATDSSNASNFAVRTF